MKKKFFFLTKNLNFKFISKILFQIYQYCNVIEQTSKKTRKMIFLFLGLKFFFCWIALVFATCNSVE